MCQLTWIAMTDLKGKWNFNAACEQARAYYGSDRNQLLGESLMPGWKIKADLTCSCLREKRLSAIMGEQFRTSLEIPRIIKSQSY